MTERNRALARIVDDAIVVLDQDGLILDLNGPAERLFARTERDAFSQSFAYVLPHPHGEAVWGQLRRGAPSPLRIELPLRAGSRLPIELRSQILHGGQDSIEYIVLIRDLSIRQGQDLLPQDIVDIDKAQDGAVVS